MKNVTTKIGVIMAAAVAASSASALDVRVKAGQLSGTYEVEYTSGTSSGYKAESDFDGVQVSAALIFDNGMYIELGSATSESDGGEVESNDNSTHTGDFERDEASLTLGTSIGDHGAVYVGYKSAVSTIDYPATYLGAGRGGEDEYTAQGVVFGGGYGIPFGESGVTLGGNLGMGIMMGELSDAALGVNYEADYTFGYSYGLALTYAPSFAPGLTVGADYRGQLYEYDFSTSSANSDFTSEETLEILNIYAQYTF